MMSDLTRAQRQEMLALRPWKSLLAIAYASCGYLAGLACILNARPTLHVLGVPLLVHTTVLSGLLNHELMHRAVFRGARWNDRCGSFMSLFNGGCYVPFSLLRKQHLAHHAHKVGYDSFSVTDWVQRLPSWARQTLVALEFCYVPILSFISRGRALASPFFNAKYAAMRGRVALVFCIRAALLAALGVLQPWALLSYFIAHLGMITVFRLFDCYHHTFDIIPLGSAPPKLPDGYEQERTFSSLFSRRHAWINTLFLNYGYHNAHHYLLAAPWYRLPEIDGHLFGEQGPRHILWPDWFIWYHRNRISRIFKGLGRPEMHAQGPKIDNFYGVIMNLSFMDYDYNDVRGIYAVSRRTDPAASHAQRGS